MQKFVKYILTSCLNIGVLKRATNVLFLETLQMEISIHSKPKTARTCVLFPLCGTSEAIG